MTMSKHDGIIDSRDVNARIEELEAELADAILFDDGWIIPRSAENDTEIAMDEEYDELEDLKALVEEAKNCCSWDDGEILINDTYFTEYAENYADEIGAIDNEHHWPLGFIDWERAADHLKMDYSSVEFGSETFWVRSS